jgi:hypothetical protein
VRVDRVAPAADRLAFLGQSRLLGDIVRIRVEIVHALRHGHALGILPWPLADAIARVDAGGAARLGRAQVGAPVGIGRAGGAGERLAMRVGAGKPTEVRAITLPTLVTKNVMPACCACAGPAMASPVNATAAKSGSPIPDVMEILPILDCIRISRATSKAARR